MLINQAERSIWDSFFTERAEQRRRRPLLADFALQADHPFEVFIGPDRTNFREREPSFRTLEQASRWARGFCDGADWRVRRTTTGELLFDSEAY